MTKREWEKPKPVENPDRITAKGCPFCGRIEASLLDTMDAGVRKTWVWCGACNAAGPAKDSRFDAVAAWNERRIVL